MVICFQVVSPRIAFCFVHPTPRGIFEFGKYVQAGVDAGVTISAVFLAGCKHSAATAYKTPSHERSMKSNPPEGVHMTVVCRNLPRLVMIARFFEQRCRVVETAVA